MSKALTAENVTLKIDGRTVFDNINMEISSSEICAICGGEDSEKERFADLLLRKYNAKYKLGGYLEVNGVEIEKLSERDMRYMRMFDIGVLPSVISADLSKFMTGETYIKTPFEDNLAISRKEILIEARRILNIMGIENTDKFLKKRTSSMTKRELRILYYAAVLATTPGILIMENAGSEAYNEEYDEIIRLIIKICKIRNIAFVIITDDTDFAEKYCERIFFVKDGKLFETDSEEYKEYKAASHIWDITLTNYGEKEAIRMQSMMPNKQSFTINETVYEGEIFGIHTYDIRQSLKPITGKSACVTGRIMINGKNIADIKPFERKICEIWEDIKYSFPENITVKKLLTEYASSYEKSQKNKAVFDAMTAVGFDTSRTDTYIKDLSRTACIKLGICCAILADAKVLIISGAERLKHIFANEIFKTVSKVCSEHKLCAVVLSSDREMLSSVCHKTAE